MSTRRYAPLPEQGLEKTLMDFASGDPRRITEALLGAAMNSPDRAIIEACALAFSSHADYEVRRASVLTLGHLARRFRRINREAVGLALGRLESDSELRPVVEELREDLTAYSVDL